MKTIKVIDLLDKIANGEEVPEKIIYRGNRFKYCEMIRDYQNDNSFNEDYLFDRIDSGLKLTDYVEIIEDIPKEDKKIEKMEFCYEVADKMQNANNERFRDFINEIIDYINKLEKPSITISDINGNTINFDEKIKLCNKVNGE